MTPLDYVVMCIQYIDSFLQNTFFYFTPSLGVSLEDIFIGGCAVSLFFAVVGKLYE